MKNELIVVAVLMFVGCGRSSASHGASDKQLRVALAHTNDALTESQDRAARYQKAYEKEVRKHRVLHHKKKK